MYSQPGLRVGIDVGGTNTDAVILDPGDRLLGKAKVPTSRDVMTGIVQALGQVLVSVPDARARITHVMVGSTHATNAILQQRGLDRVAVLRIATPVRSAIPPLVSWPAALREHVEVASTVVQGGFEFDRTQALPLDEDAIRRFAAQVAGRSAALAVTAMFAPVSEEHELRAEQIIREELGPRASISLSHELGSLGLIERENATVLNASLRKLAVSITSAIRDALAAQQITAETLFAQNDGTLMTAEFAERFPVLTIGSGQANSIRGAAYLTGLKRALVADIGGTSTDVGALVNGFPRQSTEGSDIGGVATNFRAPDLVSIAFGGGTVIGGDAISPEIGPESVGYRLREEALVFGGSTATMTDAAVAGGRAALGEAAGLGRRGAALFAAALRRGDEMLADVVDRVKLSREAQPLIAVGGGSILAAGQIPGVSEVIRPDHFDVANAIGAAIAAVSGEFEGVVNLGSRSRRQVLEEAEARAAERAIAAGADPDAVEIVDVEEIPIGYLTNTALRIRVRAVGPLRYSAALPS
ncbi:MAG: hydantoinase/oxoprolinase N-terminal domain-containing protein [Streptosporangiaceae bacterium]